MYANLTILRTYAARMDPAEIPPTIRLCHTEDSVTVFDRWPKGRFHFLLLPRARPEAGLHERHLRDLHAILEGLPREDARALLVRCRADAQEVLAHIRAEMVRAEGFEWDVQVGFHVVPSLEYVTSSMKHLTHAHIHIMSKDFMGNGVKTKKHMNSFHPKLGFFIHLDDVISWLKPDVRASSIPDIHQRLLLQKEKLDKKEYEELLKKDLTCPHCDEKFKQIPQLKTHLAIRFEKMVKQHKKANPPPPADAGSADTTEPNPEPTQGATIIDVDALENEPARRAAIIDVDAPCGTAEAGAKRKRGDEEAEEADGEPGDGDTAALPPPDHPAKKQQTAPAGSSEEA